MSKTLVTILNHNLPEYTDELYKSLQPYSGETYDIMVLDNGSDTKGKSEYTTHETGQNTYFGGAMNVVFDYMLANKQYDSLLYLSNDVILHGYDFVNSLRGELFNNDYTIVSPCIFQPTHDQGFWRQMHNWNSKVTRPVKWVDFMSPLIHRKLIEDVKQIDMKLIYGWGIDMYFGLLCEDKDWKIGVVDNTPAVHLVAQTSKKGKSDITFDEYCKKAHDGMDDFFQSNNLWDRQQSLIKYAQNYKGE